MRKKGRSRQKQYSNKEIKLFVKNHRDEKLRKAQERQKRIDESILRMNQDRSFNQLIRLFRKLKVRFYPKDVDEEPWHWINNAIE